MSTSAFPLVSVAIATYNGEKYLEEQLDSIYAQTYPNLEVVVTDDCSRDRTVEILETYRQRHGLKYWINKKNLGFIRNFEQAMSKAQGEFIALADQDDIWKPERISTLVKEIGHYTLIYAPALEYIHRDGYLAPVPVKQAHRQFLARYGTGQPVKQLLSFNWVVSHQMMFRRSLLEAALPIPQNQKFHDAWLAAVAASLGGIIWLDRDLMLYRQHETSATYDEAQWRPSSIGSWVKRWRSRSTQNPKRDIFQAEIMRLMDARQSPNFLPQVNYIDGLIAFYKQRLQPGIHWSALPFAIRHADSFFYNTDKVARAKFLISALIEQI